MEIQLTPEQESLLVTLATHKGQAADTPAADVIGQYLDAESRFVAAVELGEDELDRGEYFTSEQVGTHIERLFNS